MMRRVQFDRYGPPEVLYVGEAPVPELGPGEVLVRVHGASVNGGEPYGRAGRLRLVTRGPFPRGTGVDFAGEVVQTGGATPGVGVGDRVWGIVRRRDYATGRGGSLADYVAVPANLVSASPAGLDLVQAGALPGVGTTAVVALEDKVGLRPGERLLVRGASGGVGSIAVQLGQALGAHVTGLASRRNLDLVRELGADEAYDYATVQPADLGPFDVILDTVGRQMPAYRRLLSHTGRMVTITPDITHLAGSLAAVAASVRFGSRRIRLFEGNPTRAQFAALAAHVDDGHIRPVIDTIHPMSDIAAAHRALEAHGSRGKHVIQVR